MPSANDSTTRSEVSTAPCEVCGDPVPEGLRYMAGPFAGRMFCESHDPLRGGPRATFPELGTDTRCREAQAGGESKCNGGGYDGCACGPYRKNDEHPDPDYVARAERVL